MTQMIQIKIVQVKFHLLLVSLVTACSLSANETFDNTEKLLQSGQFRAALSSYQTSLTKAKTNQQKKIALTGIGHSLYLLNDSDEAIEHLKQALSIKSEIAKQHLDGQIHYYLSLAYSQLNELPVSRSHWETAMQIANREVDYLLKAYLHLAALKRTNNKETFYQHLGDIIESHKQADKPGPAWSAVYVNLAESLFDHPSLDPINSTDRTRIRKIYNLLITADNNSIASSLRLQSQILRLKGRLYELDERHREALALTTQALKLAKQISADDLIIFSEWQSGRLYDKLSLQKESIESYRRAVTYLDTTRRDIPIRYQDGKSSFKELMGPLYRELSELLLKSAMIQQGDGRQSLLRETQLTLEKLKQTEFEDFFLDRCLINNKNLFASSHVERETAILYPVQLNNQFVWLIAIKDKLHQISIAQDKDSINRYIRQYTSDLRRGIQNSINRYLYQILISPIEPLLQENNIETLIYLPDGSLRLLPLGVLSNGQQYLIEHYAIATLTGLNLINRSLDSTASGKGLLVGLSQPGTEVVKQLPASLLEKLAPATIPANPSNHHDSLVKKSRSVSKAFNTSSFRLPDNPADQQKALEAMADALALPGVVSEINQLGENLPNQSLLDSEFTLGNFETEVKDPSYNIVHIASHGFFSSESKDSFIMSYDKLLSLDKLDVLLRNRQSDKPIDILTLSACQTAEGDDRAPMGLSGAAIKANAQSAIGSLWPISDQAALELMTSFYQHWISDHHSKAKALQLAQLQLLKKPETSNPFYWAPFILVGNWK